ncbi:uncharacterized protein C35A5.10-like [Mercenaria mercenaria]|uniref:uncharacterized protein C35A5.10-like n=1 Tax=Mercenaria mercenaria TaxID=6596 RepID=UPI00234FB1FA|nr:uncharacterized protein C35A5.10-like [Mercenaria mercenaria]
MSAMFKLTIVVIIAIFLTQDSQGRRKKPKCGKKCISKVWGPDCPNNICKPGYTCVKVKNTKRCCRDPVCPSGWIEGDSCNLLPGQEICPEGYECINNSFCCRSTFCPGGSIGPVCSSKKGCKDGYECIGGNCCRLPLCPAGWIRGGVCNLNPGEPFCKPGFECSNDYCCKNPYQ